MVNAWSPTKEIVKIVSAESYTTANNFLNTLISESNLILEPSLATPVSFRITPHPQCV